MFPIYDLPFYDYAPDVRVVGDYLYFCDFFRTKDPESGVFERIPETFDDDCSNITPIYGVGLEPETMKKNW